jgi:16S rRNA (adenine1518-N6/adenine1519-N6)-dimethyltransferase
MHQIQLLRKHGIRPKKPWGQNFLVDENIQRKIIFSLDLKPEDRVLEIGAGLGALTDGLLNSGAQVYAVEKDPVLAGILSEELASYENLRVLREDILNLDLSRAAAGASGKWKVVGNLPYFVTSPILFYLIDNRRLIESAVVMVQREVADRILATPGSKTYGRVTLAFRYHAEVEHLFDVSRHSFTPEPAVDSSVLRIVFSHKKPRGLDEDLLFRIIQFSFSSRRKNILNNLDHSPLGIERAAWQNILAGLKIPTLKRAEELLLKDYLDLTLAVQKSRPPAAAAKPVRGRN